MLAVLAAVDSGDVWILVVAALLLLGGYLAYTANYVGAVLCVIFAVVAAIIGNVGS